MSPSPPGGEGPSSLADVAGTIIHFAAFNAGVIALVKPLRLDPTTSHFYLPAAAGSPAIFALVLVLRRRIGRLEGAALCLLYGAYLAAAILVST